MFKRCLLLIFLFSSFLGVSCPFDYDLHLTSIPGPGSKTMICFHGMGGNYQIAQFLKENTAMDETLIAFNFPDYDLPQVFDATTTKFGTIEEILPAIYLLKKCILEDGLEEINLYGYSAGGGAIINTLAILNTSTYDACLKEMGVTQEGKNKILEVLQKGFIILDAPMKSLGEVIDFRGSSKELETVATRFYENCMEPIVALEHLENLSLHFIVNFQNPDEVLSNRDDALFIARLKKYNSKGTTSIVTNPTGGHSLPHPALWQEYFQRKHGYKMEKQQQKFLIGIKVNTSNEKCPIDCPLIWEKFLKEKVFEKIPSKISNNCFGLYTDYEGDCTKPFAYVVGCEVSTLDSIPEGMVGITIPKGKYVVFTAKGPFPQSMSTVWQEIWAAPIQRAYKVDYEVYTPDFRPQGSPEINIYVSLMD